MEITDRFYQRALRNKSLKYFKTKNVTLSAGFEPARGNPNGFLVYRNHSATDV
jgi:hypothetical protein